MNLKSYNVLDDASCGIILILIIKKKILTFIIEAVDSVNAGALVVTPQQEKILWVFDLVGKQ